MARYIYRTYNLPSSDIKHEMFLSRRSGSHKLHDPPPKGSVICTHHPGKKVDAVLLQKKRRLSPFLLPFQLH